MQFNDYGHKLNRYAIFHYIGLVFVYNMEL